MKVGAISGDLLVKISLGVVLLGGAAFVLWQLKNKISTGSETLVGALNPVNPGNIVAGGVNAVGGAIAAPGGAGTNADGSWTLGGWLFDVFNPDTAAAVKDLTTSSYLPAGQQNVMNYETNDGNRY